MVTSPRCCWILALLVAIVSPSIGFAQLLVSEEFAYPQDNGLGGGNGGLGFENSWQGTGPANLITNASLSDPSGELVHSGAAVIFHNGSNSRQFTPINLSEGSTWFSFLIQPLAPTQPTQVSGGIYLGSGANPMDGYFWGYSEGAWGVGRTPQSYDLITSTTNPAVINGEAYLVVGRIDANKTSYFWINPIMGTTPSTMGSVDPSGSVLGLIPENLSGILIGGNDVIIDEIRIGRTFSDVTPIPEPSTTGIVLGLFSLFWLTAVRIKRRNRNSLRCGMSTEGEHPECN